MLGFLRVFEPREVGNVVAVTLGNNINAIRAVRRLERTSDQLASTTQKLSSGLRINAPSDDAAGLAISTSLRTDQRVFTTAVRNANDFISALTISEGGLKQLVDITIRQRELATQAASGSYSIKQRAALNKEANALVDEFNRITQSTEFNGQRLLDGNFLSVRAQVGYGSTDSLEFGVGSALQRTVGNGSFQGITTVTSGTFQGSSGLALGDFNNDGNLDIVSGDTGYINLGIGNGQFGAGTGLALNVVAGNVYGIEAIDANGDGKLDIVAAGGSGIGVAIGQGDGTFAAIVSIAGSGGFSPYQLSSADLNGDGVQDLIASGLNGAVSGVTTYLGTGTGTFARNANYTTGGATTSSHTVADFDGDDILDIASTPNGTSYAIISLGNGDGTFRTGSTVVTSAAGATTESLIAADFDGDGKNDLVLMSTDGQVRLMSGNGNGTFRAGQIIDSSTLNAGYGALSATDIDGDNKIDIVRGQLNGGVRVLRNQGSGNFVTSDSDGGVGGGQSTSSVRLGDVNGDGVLDAVTNTYPVASAPIGVFLSNTGKTSNSSYFDLKSISGARKALDTLDGTLNRVLSESAHIGAQLSRLSSISSLLGAKAVALADAESRISNVDVAAESAELVRNSILQRTTAQLLSQINLEPRIALKLFTN